MFLILSDDIQRCLLVHVFLFKVQGTRSQRETIIARRTDFLTEQQRLTHIIKYRNEKDEAKDKERKKRQNSYRQRTSKLDGLTRERA